MADKGYADRDRLLIRPKNLKGEDGYKTFSIRIRNNIVADIDVLSEKTGRSRNELIGILLSYAIKKCEIDDSKEGDKT